MNGNNSGLPAILVQAIFHFFSGEKMKEILCCPFLKFNCGIVGIPGIMTGTNGSGVVD